MLKQLVEALEQQEELDKIGGPLAAAVSSVTSSKPVKNLLSGTWLGHQLHPMLTDVPIGLWLAAGLVDVLGGRSGAAASRRLVGLGVLAALPTAATGASDWAETVEGEQRVGVIHAAYNVTGVLLQTASYVARARNHRGRGVALSAAALGGVLAGGYLGGHLAFARGVGVNHTAFEDRTSDWTDVGALEELSAGSPKRVDGGGTPVVLVREGDRVHALSATCTHAGGPLDEGEVRDGCIVCPWHGSTFHLDDGSIVRGPATIDEPVWEVRVDAGRVAVRAQQS